MAFDPYAQWLGLPAESRDHYSLLGLPRFAANPHQIAAAAAHRLAHLGSLRQPQNAAWIDALAAELVAAREALLHPQAKAAYDAQLNQALSAVPTADRFLAMQAGGQRAAAPRPLVAARPLPVAKPMPGPTAARPAASAAASAPLPVVVAARPVESAGPAVPVISVGSSTSASSRVAIPGRRRRNETTTYALLGLGAVAMVAGIAVLVGSGALSTSRPKPSRKGVAQRSRDLPVARTSAEAVEQNPFGRGAESAATEMEEVVELASSAASGPVKPAPLPPEVAATGTPFEQTVARVKPSIVWIEGPAGHGSGVVVSEQGIIATNFHVVEGIDTATVIFADGKKFPVEGCTYYSEECDLCLLKIDPEDYVLRPLPVASELPAQGASVFTFGNPKGLKFTITKGVVSATTTTHELKAAMERSGLSLSKEGNATWIQTDASIAPGNSGGPLLNEQGVVLGLNTFLIGMIPNAFFANSGPDIVKAMSMDSPVQSLASLPRRDLSKVEPAELIPGEIIAALRQDFAKHEFERALKMLVAHRDQALLTGKIVMSSQAGDLQQLLAELETGRTSILEALGDPDLAMIGGDDFSRYLALLETIDQTIERSGDIEGQASALAGVLKQSSGEMTKITAACMLHRIHLRESSRAQIPVLLDYLQTQNNFAARAMRDWYLENRSVEVASVQVQLIADVRTEEERNRDLLNDGALRAKVVALAQNRVDEYNEKLGIYLFERGLENWRFRCIPTSKGLEFTFGLGLCQIVLPPSSEITQPCDVLLSAQVLTRGRAVIALSNDLKYQVRIPPSDLKDVRLWRIVAEADEGTRVVAVPLPAPAPAK